MVTTSSDPHDFILTIDYREEQGRQFSINSYGTDITCAIRLEDDNKEILLDLTVQESSGDQNLGTPPYIEAVSRFETNPYIYLLGDVVKGRTVMGLDTTGSLIKGLERLAAIDTSGFDPLSAPHSLSDADSPYGTQALYNTIQEVGRLEDLRALPVLTQVLHHRDAHARLLSVQVLGRIGSSSSRPALEHVAEQDEDQAVREAARNMLASLSGS